MDNIIPLLEDLAFLIIIPLAGGGAGKVDGDKSVDPFLIIFVGIYGVFILVSLELALLSRTDMHIIEQLRSNQKAMLKQAQLGNKLANLPTTSQGKHQTICSQIDTHHKPTRLEAMAE